MHAAKRSSLLLPQLCVQTPHSPVDGMTHFWPWTGSEHVLSGCSMVPAGQAHFLSSGTQTCPVTGSQLETRGTQSPLDAVANSVRLQTHFSVTGSNSRRTSTQTQSPSPLRERGAKQAATQLPL